MRDRRREVESLFLAAFAAMPLYLTAAIGMFPLVLFHLSMALIIYRVSKGGSPEIMPPEWMRALAIAFVPFYVIDAAIISRGAFPASTHLVLFIAVYQATESSRENNSTQRLLTTAMIFIASIATSTHITVTFFVIVFAFLLFRELMHASHVDTAMMIDKEYGEAPSSRAAAFYLCGTTIIGVLLFPLLPRVRSPFVQGIAGALTSATTGLSDSIDFNQERQTPTDPTVIARVWMGQEAIPFFTPLRLRGVIYDRFLQNEWLQSRAGFYEVRPFRGEFRVAHPVGFTRSARVQQRYLKGTRLFFPSGTYAIRGVPQLFEGPPRGSYATYQAGRDIVTYEVGMALWLQPLERERIAATNYPVTPAVAALARSMVGDSTKPTAQAAKIESYLSRNFQYVQAGQHVGRPMTVDEFLLRERRGHCEYFAAGMVALMTSLNVPSRIVGGFYGGRLNPLTGYFIVRREDAHAWVEVWDGGKWLTFDPTPTALRPGGAQPGLLGMYATAISDSVNYYWDRYVLTYGLADQVALAAEVIARVRDAMGRGRRGAATAARQIASPQVVTSLALLVGFVAAILAAARRRRSAFDLLAGYLASIGIRIGPAMTMEEALRELRRRRPDIARDLEPLIAFYEAERFSSQRDRQRIDTIRRRLAEMKA